MLQENMATIPLYKGLKHIIKHTYVKRIQSGKEKTQNAVLQLLQGMGREDQMGQGGSLKAATVLNWEVCTQVFL